jgi:cytochrome P450
METQAFNPLSPDFITNPYPLYKELRALGPLATDVGWVLSRHADVMAALVSESVGHLRTPPGDSPYDVLQRMFLRVNRPDHTKIRSAIAPLFTPPRGKAQAERSGERAGRILADASERGELDVVNDLAAAVGGRTVGDLLGVDPNAVPSMLELSRILFKIADPFPSLAALQDIEAAGRQMAALMTGVVADHERTPREDMVSALLESERQGEIGREDVIGACILMVLAGVETTSALIGTAVLALFENPDQLELLRQRPQLAPRAIDEFARYHSPTQRSTRLALADLDIGGTPVRAGETMLLLFGSANRDPLAFDEPERLDLTRQAPHHLGFGRGMHYCLGIHIARWSGGAMLNELLRHSIRPAVPLAEVQWRDSHTIRGLETFPVIV